MFQILIIEEMVRPHSGPADHIPLNIHAYGSPEKAKLWICNTITLFINDDFVPVKEFTVMHYVVML